MPRVVRAATKVVVFQCPCGTLRAGHVGLRPGLVDEDEALRIEVELAIEPGFAPLQDVGTILFRGMGGLFLRVISWRAKKRRIVPKPNDRPFSPST
jgi:hypothetical protein